MGAPYRFARVNRWVHFPDWAHHVSHDVPFEDGFCGTIRFDVQAMTPVLVGGPQHRVKGQVGDIWPVRLPDGRYALPPSSLQGMVRSILAVAAFGKLGGRVEDRRFAVRDLSGTATSKMLFQERLTSGEGTVSDPYDPNTKAGWLIRRGRAVELVSCSVARIAIADLIALNRAAYEATLSIRTDAKARLKLLTPNDDLTKLEMKITLHGKRPHPHSGGNHISYEKASIGGKVDGTLVLTGKPQSGLDGDGFKKQEFVFHTPNRTNAPSHAGSKVPADVWRDFIDIHNPPKGSGRRPNPNWEFWKAEFEAGKPVPVFYLEEGGKITAMGTAFMFKAAMPLSTHDLLSDSTPFHFCPKLDLPSLIFGAVKGDHDEMSLKRRASFGFGATNGSSRLAQYAVSLMAPKPAYYPTYVRQQEHESATIPETLPYAAYTNYPKDNDLGSARMRSELAGTKWYPARGGYQGQSFGVQDPATQPNRPPAKPGPDVFNLLHALPINTTFPDIPLHLHNLRKVEVGAILWALCFGKAEHLAGMESPLRHRLGMGKPLGLGEIRIGNVRIALEANDGSAPPDAATFIQAFVDHMNAHYPGGQWEKSVQVQALLKAANPEEAHGALTYHGSYQEYSTARAAGHFLPDYVTGHEIARPGGETDPQPGAGRPPPAAGGGGRGGGHGGHPGGGGRGPQRGQHRRDRGPPPRPAPPRYPPNSSVLVRGQRGKVLMFEDGEYIVQMADGTERSVPPEGITPIGGGA